MKEPPGKKEYRVCQFKCIYSVAYTLIHPHTPTHTYKYIYTTFLFAICLQIAPARSITVCKFVWQSNLTSNLVPHPSSNGGVPIISCEQTLLIRQRRLLLSHALISQLAALFILFAYHRSMCDLPFSFPLFTPSSKRPPHTEYSA